MTVEALKKLLEEMPDEARVFYVDRRVIGAGTRRSYDRSELRELRKVKSQSKDYGLPKITGVGFTDKGPREHQSAYAEITVVLE